MGGLHEIKTYALELGGREVQPEDVLFHARAPEVKRGLQVKQHFKNVTFERPIPIAPTNVLPTPRRPEFAVTRVFDVEQLLAEAPVNKVSQTSLETWRGARIGELGLSPRYPPAALAEAPGRGAREWSRQKDGRLTLPWRVKDDTNFTTNYTGFESREVTLNRAVLLTSLH